MRILILAAVFIIGFLYFSFIPSYGHGVGAETLPPVMIGNRNVTLAIGLSQASTDPANTDREIGIQLFETNSKELVNDVTFLVKTVKNNKTLFEHEFKSDKGSLVMIMIKTESEEVQFIDGSTLKKLFESLFGPNNDSVYIIKGPIFDSAGLYQFHIEIL
ncbi:MAG: hypothetical protein ACRD94_05190, partial [Nitrosopumilaceae archaeon]